MDTAKATTLFPKITGHERDLLENIRQHTAATARPHSPPASYPFLGTVKLHGTHADILIPARDDAPITYQSRNRADVTRTHDNLGFAAFAAARDAVLRALRTRVVARHASLHPSAPSPEASPLLLAGEWIGKGIQREVGVALLSRRFVVYGLRFLRDISGGESGEIAESPSWEPIDLYPEASAPDAGIYHIGVGGYFYLTFDTKDAGAGFFSAAKKLTMEVARSCPFARASGIEGPGEGIVWVPAVSTTEARTEGSDGDRQAGNRLPCTAEFWIKTKADGFANRVARPRAWGKVDAKKGKGTQGRLGPEARARAFAIEVCAVSRLEQGWDYLREMGVEQNMEGLETFVEWVVRDVEVEEKWEIEELEIGDAWKDELARKAEEWFERRLAE